MTVVLDNLKVAIFKADRYDPVAQRTFEEYARYRSFVLDPTRSRDPTGKPHVERSIPYIRESFFRGETWLNLEHVQREARRWCLEVAGTRIHGTTRQRPLAVFENVERSCLTPLQGERFDPPHWAEHTVHPDCHISFQRSLYSVPHGFRGRKVWVRGDQKLVRIYVDGTLVKTHARQPPGRRATDYDNYPAELTHYTLRDLQRMIRQARSQGPDLDRFKEGLLSRTVPWAKLRQTQKLLCFCTKYGWPRLNTACRRALIFKLINVHRIEPILLQDLDPSSLPTDTDHDTLVIPLNPCFQRPPGSFTQPQPKEVSSIAQKTSLGVLDLLELALQDGIDRCENKNLSTRLDQVAFEEAHTFEDFDWDAPVTFDRLRGRGVFSFGFPNPLDMRKILPANPRGAGSPTTTTTPLSSPITPSGTSSA